MNIEDLKPGELYWFNNRLINRLFSNWNNTPLIFIKVIKPLAETISGPVVEFYNLKFNCSFTQMAFIRNELNHIHMEPLNNETSI